MALNRIQKRKERRKKVFMSIFLSFLMVASGFGIYLSGRGSERNSVQEHGLSFFVDHDNRVYRTKIDGQKMNFYYLPSTVQDVEMAADAIAVIRDAQAAVITFDPLLDSFNLQAIDILRFDFANALQKPVINAVTQESPLYVLPVITCANATPELPVISVSLADEPAIIREGNCVKLMGNVSGFLEVRDRFLYEYFDVYDGG